MSLTANEILSGMNEPQQEAVKHTEGPLLIMAGAGSGKTRVLTHRIAYLLSEKDVNPYNVLAITFTNKAAREMKERVENLVGEDAKDIIMSTFHSLCVRILRRDGDRIGLDRNFAIYDMTDQLSVVKEALRLNNLDPKKFEPKTVLFTISGAKNQLKTPKEFKEEANNYFEETIAQLYESYEAILRKNQAIDFDGLIMETINLFKRVPEVLQFYQNRFHYIHVDEYQDTNRAQYQLVNMLASRFKNLCVVGDSDQSIYKWRGADIYNILSFEEDYPNAKVTLLEQNYRSTKMILQAANDVIEKNTSRKPKKLWTDNPDGTKIRIFEAFDERQEARYVVDQIQEITEEGNREYRDFAVLYRTNAQSRAMEDVFMKSDIPYQIIGGTKFYDRKEIKDLLAYLRLIANPHDDISLTRVVNVPKRGIGKTSIEKLQMHAEMSDQSLFDAILESDFAGISKKAVNQIHAFRQLIEQWQKQQEFLSVTELVQEVLTRSGYEEELNKDRSIEAQGRLENLDEFKTVTQQFEETNDDQSLIAFLTDLALVSDLDQTDVETDNKVTLMTLHSAKGLEFPIVFLIGMEENIFPHSRSLFEEEEMEEERRLAYVGITRAEQLLYLTYASSRTIFGRPQSNQPSRFIGEIPSELVEREGTLSGMAFQAGGSFDQAIHELSNKQEQPKPKRRARKMQNQPTSPQNWSPGDKVAHKKWGQGTVVKVEGDGEDIELDIAFPSPVGVKRLLAQFAPINKIE
ncbi:DNA helicase PcrA [Tenuibacillus multivorans]|uniref:ATP-dependent DNA helicase n=1 Tax=Tenuibacillus multivorans TaxID=237069 RepID=A0A1H0E154_9BACI|nr:DNA helicase PcrA [Tenuibacillus multivorans]GEL76693.1 ATP-dependent DNA helicase PcrA [Tenuibacillus multivorans]SDN76174.1 DNA helicase-2 / ATP-dependent DNA helicase PcrA [Tenuibacillus multivorans]